MQAPAHMHDDIGQHGLLLMSRAHLVPRVHKANAPPAMWRRDLFAHGLNPVLKQRQFGHLHGRDLRSIFGLPRWMQAQELNHVFDDMDVLIIHSVDIEHCGLGAPGIGLLVIHGFDAAMTKHTLNKVTITLSRRLTARWTH